ncbi:MAG: DUF1015 domain-containing protein [Dehalococcoidales bacterium]|nr:DUF1015 domain-containing protein [Dehalococcoidales bacterium]
MADIQPFRGLRYRKSLVKDFSKVICPPYDIISPSFHEELHTHSEYNFIRLEDAKTFPQDTPSDNKYNRAAASLQQWLSHHVLILEKKPAIYLHDHYFQHQGKEQRRRGIIARVRLEEWESKIVRPHEGILVAARDDRLNLLWALQINTSPVLAMYEDKRKQLARLLENQEGLRPVIDTAMPNGERHTLRAIIDKEVVRQISNHFNNLPIYIADGHHRYTSALTYRREKSAVTPGTSPNDAVNFIMMTLVSFTDPGLTILAPHRLIRGIQRSVIDNLEIRLSEFFEIQKLPLDTSNIWQKIDRLMIQTDTVHFSCFMTGADHLCALTLKEHSIDGQTMPLFHSEIYRKLDVSIIDHIILEKILGLGIGGTDEAKIDYSYDRQDAMDMVLRQEYQLAFFLKPVKPSLIKAVADANDKMPRKSTYFYPKAPAGLVINRLIN